MTFIDSMAPNNIQVLTQNLKLGGRGDIRFWVFNRIMRENDYKCDLLQNVKYGVAGGVWGHTLPEKSRVTILDFDISL